MSVVDWDPAGSTAPEESSGVPLDKSVNVSSGGTDPEGARPALHRLAVVRRQQGMSQRNVARRLNVDIGVVRAQEDATADLPLSTLYEWQKILEVPVVDLLIDSDIPLSRPVLERARMLKLMKTAVAIMEKARSTSLRRLVAMFVEQILEIMPEFQDVAPWHTVGQRRTLDDYGRAAERQVPDDLLRRLSK